MGLGVQNQLFVVLTFIIEASAALAPPQKQRLYKILSALWNLAEDPIENKRVMCHDFPAFVPLLLRIMFSDAREVPLIQTATGILRSLSGIIFQRLTESKKDECRLIN